MNQEIINELISYRRVVLYGSIALLSLIAAALFGSVMAGCLSLSLALVGAFAGTVLSSINVFALGYAFYALTIKKLPRRVILWPILTFLCMCGVALYLALLKPDYILGYALALTSPLVFGAIIALRA